MILTNEYLGHVTMDNTEHVVAGSVDTWRIVYTAGKYGIDDTGSIRIAWRNPSDWGMPQFGAPTGIGFTTVHVNGNAKISTTLETFERPYNNSIVVTVYDGFLVEGDTITIVLGDKSQGSNGMRSQTFCEEEHEFRVFVDPYGSRRYQRLPNDIVFPIYSGAAHEIQVVAPSVFDPQRTNEVLIRAIDYYGNISKTFEDSLLVTLFCKCHRGEKQSINVSMTEKDRGLARFVWPYSLEDGVYYFGVSCNRTGLSAISNAHIVKKGQRKLYFGDMHGQTSATVGTGSLDSYFSFARDSAFVDFSGWQGNDFQINDEKWYGVREATRKYHKTGEFVTFLGYEWSGLTPNGGDHNVYFLDDNETFYPNSNWLEPVGSADAKNNAPTLPELFSKIVGREDVMVIPHIGGRYATMRFFDPNFTPVIEVHSHHGTFEWFIFDAMKARLKVGFIGSSDDHTCRPGMSYPLSKDGKASSFDVASGYTALYADSLTRENVWKALKSRYCYATTFNRMVLDTHMSGYHMGEEVSELIPATMTVSVHSSSPIDTIELYNWDMKIGHANLRPKDMKRVRVAWSGVRVRTRKKSTKWDGTLEIINGRILKAEEYSFDRRDQGIVEQTETKVRWVSNTSGDYDGLILELDYNQETELVFRSEQIEFTRRVCDIGEDLTIYPAGGENLKVEVSLANRECSDFDEFIAACNVEHTFTCMNQNKEGGNAYWVRVLQEDGNMAWSSPIFTK